MPRCTLEHFGALQFSLEEIIQSNQSKWRTTNLTGSKHLIACYASEADSSSRPVWGRCSLAQVERDEGEPSGEKVESCLKFLICWMARFPGVFPDADSYPTAVRQADNWKYHQCQFFFFFFFFKDAVDFCLFARIDGTT